MGMLKSGKEMERRVPGRAEEAGAGERFEKRPVRGLQVCLYACVVVCVCVACVRVVVRRVSRLGRVYSRKWHLDAGWGTRRCKARRGAPAFVTG